MRGIAHAAPVLLPQQRTSLMCSPRPRSSSRDASRSTTRKAAGLLPTQMLSKGRCRNDCGTVASSHVLKENENNEAEARSRNVATSKSWREDVAVGWARKLRGMRETMQQKRALDLMFQLKCFPRNLQAVEHALFQPRREAPTSRKKRRACGTSSNSSATKHRVLRLHWAGVSSTPKGPQ